MHVMREPFTHKNIENRSICDIPCPRFDWSQDSLNKGKYHGMNQYKISACIIISWSIDKWKEYT
jgi:hypothetical protein